MRVLTRDPGRAKYLAGVEVSIGDVCDHATLDIFATGASVIGSAVHGVVGKGLSLLA